MKFWVFDIFLNKMDSIHFLRPREPYIINHKISKKYFLSIYWWHSSTKFSQNIVIQVWIKYLFIYLKFWVFDIFSNKMVSVHLLMLMLIIFNHKISKKLQIFRARGCAIFEKIEAYSFFTNSLLLFLLKWEKIE